MPVEVRAAGRTFLPVVVLRVSVQSSGWAAIISRAAGRWGRACVASGSSPMPALRERLHRSLTGRLVVVHGRSILIEHFVVLDFNNVIGTKGDLMPE
jgi:hypothetical protein